METIICEQRIWRPLFACLIVNHSNCSQMMEQQISIFEDARFGQIRTATTEGGEPLFCLADVCKALDLQTNKVKGRLSVRGWSTIPTPTHNQHGAVVEQEMTYITEPNLYKCIFQSRKATAEQFQEWVCSEVLPSIRRTGGYIESRMNERFSRFFLQICGILPTFAMLTSWSLSTRRAFGQFAHIRASHCPTENNGGCRIRKIHAKLLRSGNVHLVSSVYGDRFLFAQLSIF